MQWWAFTHDIHDPANSAITTTNKDHGVRNLPEHLQSRMTIFIDIGDNGDDDDDDDVGGNDSY